jgi:hypothetical protein
MQTYWHQFALWDAVSRGGQMSEERAGQAEMLAEMRALRGRARTTRHAYWFPLVLFGVLTFASAPLYIQPQPRADAASASGPTGTALRYFGGSPLISSAVPYYWLGALLGGLVVTQVWYRWHARRVGLQTPSLAYLATTFVLTALAASIPLLARVRSPRFLEHLQVLYPGDLVIRGTFPFVLIGAGLLMLAWAERSRALAAIAAVYTWSALLSSLYDVSNLTQRLGWTPSPSDQALPNVLLPGLILLAAGVATLVARRFSARQWFRRAQWSA